MHTAEISYHQILESLVVRFDAHHYTHQPMLVESETITVVHTAMLLEQNTALFDNSVCKSIHTVVFQGYQC